MSAGQLAALIAAVAFALLACAGVAALIRLTRLLGIAADVASGYRERADTLLEQAQAVVDRAGEQLTRTGAITASVDEVTANMAELSGHVSAMTGLASGLAQALAAPVTGLSALAYGVRHAVALRQAPAGQVHAAERPALGRAGTRSRPAAGTRR
jgi:uncharacterized protein YoxC